MKKESKKRHTISERKTKLLISGTAITICILVLAYLGISQYYKNHFYGRTFINGVDCSHLSIDDAKARIEKEVNSYVLDIQERKDISEQISGDQIELHLEYDVSFDELLNAQSPYQWITKNWTKKELDNPVKLIYDEALLEAAYDKLLAFDERYIIKPVSAYITEYEKGKEFEIVPEVDGNMVNKEKFYKEVKNAIEELTTSISIEELKCYEEPGIRGTDQKLLNAVKVANKYLSTRLTYTFGDKTEILEASVVGPAIKISDKYVVEIDEDKIKEFVDYIGSTYNTFGKTRTFMTSYGKEVSVQKGDYGWWLDRSTEQKEIIESIKLGEQKEREPVYFQKAASYDDPDYGDTYVEINLTTQHLFFYKKGKLIVESDLVSGNLARNFGTPTGTYSVTYTKKDAELKGQGYNSKVSYWMPFNGNIGMHDANWRHGRFGGSIYKTNGSHGCINLPPANAKKIFENIEKGAAVIVYELDI